MPVPPAGCWGIVKGERREGAFMTEKPFNRSDAESLLQPIGTGNYWKIKKRGVWPKKPVKKHKEEKHTHEPGELIDLEFASWRPVMVFSASTLPQRPEDRPALPFPFDAKDLAAFMLYGFGPLVADHYGDWEDGPDQLRLNELSSLNFAKRAVKEAFEAYREAQKIVDPYPLELDAEAERARIAWNKAGADASKETKAALDLEMEAAAAEAKAAQGKWLEDMVRVLLKPAQVQEPATPAPPETVAERRQRYLDWHLEEQRINTRGALKRVFDREAKQNPKADRSNIGKDIKLAREASKRLDNNWTSQLIRAG